MIAVQYTYYGNVLLESQKLETWLLIILDFKKLEPKNYVVITYNTSYTSESVCLVMYIRANS